MPTLLQALPGPGIWLADDALFSAAVARTAIFLGLSALIIALAAWLLCRITRLSARRRAIWQVALLCLGALSAVEMTGLAQPLSFWLHANSSFQANHNPADKYDPTFAAPAIESTDYPQGLNQTDEWDDLADENFALSEFPADLSGSTDAATPQLDVRQLGGPQLDVPQLDVPTDAPFIGPLPLAAGAFGAQEFADVAEEQLEPELAAAPNTETEFDWDDPSTAAFGFAESAQAQTNHLDQEPRSADTLATVFGLIWVAVALVFLARAVGGRILLWRYGARLPENNNSRLAEALTNVAATMNCRRVPQLKISPSLAGPLAYGMFRPTLVLPRNFSRQFTPEGQRAVFVHELAHLRQADPLWLLIADLICSALWWNPAVWAIRARFRFESELTADEATTCLVDGPEHLATSLLRLGSRLARPRAVGFVSAGGFGLRSNLARRIERLVNLDEDTCRPRRSRPFVRTLAAVCIIAGCLIGTAWARPGLPSGGDNNVSSLNRSWRTSFAGAALAALLFGGGTVGAQDSGPPDPGQDQDAAAEAAQDEVAVLEAEILSLLASKDELAARFAVVKENMAADIQNRRDRLAAEMADAETRSAAIATQIAELEAQGEAEQAHQLNGELAALREHMATIQQRVASAESASSERIQARFAEDEARLKARMNEVEDRIAGFRARGDEVATRRLEDRLALLRREVNQGARRRATDTPPEDQGAARRRAPQDRPAPRRRGEQDPSYEDRIRLILEAANNLEAAGLVDQANELREMVRTRMGPPGVGPAGQEPPRARVPADRPDAAPRVRRPGADQQGPPGDAPRVRRGGPDQPGPPGNAPRARRAGPGEPGQPGDAPRARRAGPGEPGQPGDAPRVRRGVPEPDNAPRARRGDGGPTPPEAAPQPRRRRASDSPAEEPQDGPNADRELVMLIRALQAEVNSLRSEVQSMRREMDRDDDRNPGVRDNPAARDNPGAREPRNRVRQRRGDGGDATDDAGNRRLADLGSDVADDPGTADQADNGDAGDRGTTDRGDATSDAGDPGTTDRTDGNRDQGDAGTSDAAGSDVADSGDAKDSPPNPGTANRRQ